MTLNMDGSELPQNQPFMGEGILPTFNQPDHQQDTNLTRKHRPANLDNKFGIEETSNGNMSTSTHQLSPLSSPDSAVIGSRYPYRSPSSPGRRLRSSSPSVHSPASQIFERSVQEDIIPAQASPSIPSHIMTENHIPPILEASSAAITDEQLDPDSVKIITHSIHQPAAVTVTGTSAIDQQMASSWHDDIGAYSFEPEDSASNYGTLDSADIRRLSFISFADVVHAEHVESGEQPNSREYLHNLGLLSNATPTGRNRSPSPLRSPVSSHGPGTSPPTSVSLSPKGIETSPNRGGRRPGSPLIPPTHSPSLGSFYSEINVETMRQALRRTESGDLTGTKSQSTESCD